MTGHATPDRVQDVIRMAVSEAMAAGWDCKYKHESLPGKWADDQRDKILERAFNRLATRS